MIPLLLTGLFLALLLGASEFMVRQLTVIGERLQLPPALLGLIVAIGADAPEISTAVAAMVAGSQSIGLGVVEGSNLYNLAGLLGLSGLIAGPLRTTRRRIVHDGVGNLFLTLPAVLLVLVESLRTPLAILALVIFVVYVLTVARHPHAVWPSRMLVAPVVLALIASAGIVLTSTLLVRAAVALIHQLHVTESVVAILVLPVATSLPNTWAALTLARRGLGDAVVATTFLSNGINVVFGIVLPSLIVRFNPTLLVRLVDGPYLVAMTLAVIGLLYAGDSFSSRDACVTVALYLGFLVLRLAILR